jgi:hypothetical protein
MRIRFDGKQNAVRVGQVLKDGVTRDSHRKEDKGENRDLSKFLAMEVI